MPYIYKPSNQPIFYRSDSDLYRKQMQSHYPILKHRNRNKNKCKPTSDPTPITHYSEYNSKVTKNKVRLKKLQSRIVTDKDEIPINSNQAITHLFNILSIQDPNQNLIPKSSFRLEKQPVLPVINDQNLLDDRNNNKKTRKSKKTKFKGAVRYVIGVNSFAKKMGQNNKSFPRGSTGSNQTKFRRPSNIASEIMENAHFGDYDVTNFTQVRRNTSSFIDGHYAGFDRGENSRKRRSLINLPSISKINE